MIGNKADLANKRKVTKKQGEDIRDQYDFDMFMESSAKTGFNCQRMFFEAAKLLYQEHCKYREKVRLIFNFNRKQKEMKIKRDWSRK